MHVEGSDPHEHVNDEHTNEVPMHDSNMEDHGLVDMQEFGFLVTRTTALETQIATMNESLSKVTTLLNELVRGHERAT